MSAPKARTKGEADEKMFKFIDIAEKIMRITVDTGAGSCVPPPGRRMGADERERHRERPRQDIVLVKKVEAARKRKRIGKIAFPGNECYWKAPTSGRI